MYNVTWKFSVFSKNDRIRSLSEYNNVIGKISDKWRNIATKKILWPAENYLIDEFN